jgi:hypothetical protein
MTDFTQAIQILRDLGVIQIFSIPLAFLVFLFLFKKSMLNGTGATISGIGAFLKDIIVDLLSQEKERIKTQTEIQATLQELCQKFDSIAVGMIDSKSNLTEKILNLGEDLREHIIESRSLLLLLKKKSEPIQATLDKVDTQYFKGEKP